MKNMDISISGYQREGYQDIRLSGYQDEGHQGIRKSAKISYLISWYPDIHCLMACCPDNHYNEQGNGQ